MAEEFQHADQRVADDRAAKMPDVHLLGQVRAGVVHHGRLLLGGAIYPKAFVWEHFRDAIGQKLFLQCDVYEPRPGDLEALGHVVKLGAGDDLLGQLARVSLERLGGGHYAVGLVIAELGAAGRHDHGGGIFGQADADERLLKALLE